MVANVRCLGVPTERTEPSCSTRPPAPGSTSQTQGSPTARLSAPSVDGRRALPPDAAL